MTRYENCKLSSKSDSSAALSGEKIQKIKLVPSPHAKMKVLLILEENY